jgi:hypothetical protein
MKSQRLTHAGIVAAQDAYGTVRSVRGQTERAELLQRAIEFLMHFTRANWEMIRSILWAAPLALAVKGLLHAQDANAINDLKAKIWEAELAQRNFAAGLRHCSELNGTNFYFYPRDRVLNLQDYRRSLDNLVIQGAFNPETKRPWNKQDADARWAEVQKQAITDQVRGGREPAISAKKLEELQQQTTPAGAARK